MALALAVGGSRAGTSISSLIAAVTKAAAALADLRRDLWGGTEAGGGRETPGGTLHAGSAAAAAAEEEEDAASMPMIWCVAGGMGRAARGGWLEFGATGGPGGRALGYRWDGPRLRASGFMRGGGWLRLCLGSTVAVDREERFARRGSEGLLAVAGAATPCSLGRDREFARGSRWPFFRF